MEAEFQEELRGVTVKMCYTWCASTAILLLFGFSLRVLNDLARPLPALPVGEWVVLVCHALCLALLLGLPVGLSCAPAFRRHVVPLVLTLFILLCGMSCAMIHLMVMIDVQQADDQFLSDALQGASPEAADSMEDYIMAELSKKYLLVHMSMLFFFVSILQYVPYGRGTVLVHTVVPVGIIASAFMSPAIAPASRPFLVSTVAPIIFSFFHCTHTIALRRSDFRANRQLQDAMTKEAEALEKARDMEASQKVASQKADSILNHVLKNIMADASACIDLFLAGDPREGPSLLHQAIECLARGMRWCKNRQTLLRIASGAYTPCPVPVRLRDFGERLVQGRAVTCRFLDGAFLLDAVLCDIVLDNALNNALRHGHPTDPDVCLTMTMAECAGPAPDPTASRYRLSFEVTNRAHPQRRPITPNFVGRALAGHPGPGPPSSVLSDNLGLSHIQMAAEAQDMAVSLTQTGDLVTFEATVEAEMCAPQHEEPATAQDGSSLPPGLRIFCLDDSAVARKLLAHFLPTHLPGAKVSVFGASAEEVSRFTAEAVRGADIVMLDQMLEYGGGSKFFGTDLIQALLRQGFSGCICVRSANASLSDRSDYLRSGAHCTLGKDLRPPEMVAQLAAAYGQFLRRRPTSAPRRHPDLPPVLQAFVPTEGMATSIDLESFSSRVLLPGIPASHSQSFHTIFPTTL